jgi:hypothetical protein
MALFVVRIIHEFVNITMTKGCRHSVIGFDTISKAAIEDVTTGDRICLALENCLMNEIAKNSGRLL